ncbi:jmjC domain-containing histone demethylation protein 1 [Contarinia nasturtii]|uniref:jmjC domain-containing histone demethylation protein 1 n=1 Tax=Contarinia nasturtii TaxID=265458 RepID=UPI0012D44634|nr:jmjC domain-containing histone demethylation protein 1 [Contarinia nasturtii]XP_031621169.1 jmjC domain-containing histone demethylation protein 1 [Contarinia nasturtii]
MSERKKISPSTKHSRRQLRERKQRKAYSDYLIDDDHEGARGFSVAEKLESARFAQVDMVREMKGHDLTISFFQQYGFNIPLLFKEKTGLGLRVPSSDFSVSDVRMCVGSKRLLDVMDVNTQKNLRMTMKEWQQYYEDPHKTRLLNVISLEFSHTKLDNYVQSPSIVRNLDWVDVVWPRQLKEAQVDATNSLDGMMYPKVKKYCLMSVKNCYTDFHVDFGGTSVWYHITRGSKVFWLIPPTEKNLQLYEKWVLSGKQSDVFFGDTVEKCCRVYLTAGNTFFIPTGWIHAVYTPTDSLVFGGNFLHSFGILKQLKIAKVEDTTKVPQKFRYPFFTEMLWYVLSKYVHTLLGRSHLEGEASREDELVDQPHIHLTHYELFGLKEIVMYLYDLPPQRKNVPELIKDPVQLIKDVRSLVERHCKDSPELAITGKPVLHPDSNQSANAPNQQLPNEESVDDASHIEPKNNIKIDNKDDESQSFQPPKMIPTNKPVSKGANKKNSSDATNGNERSNGNTSNAPRRRRRRCKVCVPCNSTECGQCAFCLDMIKFGGPGRAKQTCMMRQCVSPMLPVTAQCVFCHLDGWHKQPVTSPQVKSQITQELGPSSLMECSVCYEITHPECAQKACGDGVQVNGVVNEDLPNSWECLLCCRSGKNTDYKPRHFRARQKSSEVKNNGELASMSGNESKTNAEQNDEKNGPVLSDSDMDNKSNIKKIKAISPKSPANSIKKEELHERKFKPEPNDDSEMAEQNNHNDIGDMPAKRRKSDDGGSICSSLQDGGTEHTESTSNHVPRKKNTLRTQLAQQILNSSSKSLRKPSFVVRPVNNTSTNSSTSGSSSSSGSTHYTLDPTALLAIFRYLPHETLITCSLVCKTWSNVSVDPKLWRKMNCSHHKLSASLLMAIVRRQPEHLTLDWTNLAKRQLNWLIARLPALKNLSMQGTQIGAVLGLHTCLCPPLQMLDLSFVRSLNDSAIRDILSPPKDSRPGLTDSKSRLRNLKVLKLAGTDISDVALRYITQGVPSLVHLNISSCQRVTDAGVAQIMCSQSAINTLVELDLSSCKLVTELCLEYLAKCEALTYLDLRHVPQVPTQAVIKFAAKSKHNLHVRDIKLVDKRK